MTVLLITQRDTVNEWRIFAHTVSRLSRRLNLLSQIRIFDKRVTNHVADAHVRVFDAAIMRIVDDDGLVRELREFAAFTADERNRMQPHLLCPLDCLDQIG